MPQPLIGLGTGPGIVADPAGNVWLCVLASLENSVVRFASGSSKPELISVLSELGCQGIGCAGWQIDHAERHIIHMAFSQSGGRSRTAKVLYLLASSLLAGNADEAIIVFELEDDWRTSRPGGEVGLQTIWLPEDHSAAHRLQVVAPAATHHDHGHFFDIQSPSGGNGLIATGLHYNQLFFIRGFNL